MLCTLLVNYLLMTMVSPLNAFSYFNLADGLRAYLRVVLLGLEVEYVILKSARFVTDLVTCVFELRKCLKTSEFCPTLQLVMGTHGAQGQGSNMLISQGHR